MLSNKTIGERLKECRKAKKENQEDLAKLLNVQRQIISYYETGARTPNIEDLAILAKHFDTTVDYLIGLSDVKSTNIEVKSICDYTGLSEEAINRLHENFADRTFPEYLKKEFIEEVRCTEKEVAGILSELIDSDDENSLLQSVFYLQSILELDRDMAKKYEEKTKCKNITKEEIKSFLKEITDKHRFQRLDYYEAVDSFKYAVDEYLENHKLFNSEKFESLINIINIEGEADGEHN